MKGGEVVAEPIFRQGVLYNMDALRPLMFKGSRHPRGPVVQIIIPDKFGPCVEVVNFEIKKGYELCIRKRPSRKKSKRTPENHLYVE